MKIWISSLLLTACIINDRRSNVAMAFPTMAGGCDAGGAVGGNHLTYPQTTGTLITGNFQFLLDTTTELVLGTPVMITPGQIYTLSIVPTNGMTFRGALIRVEEEGVDLVPGTNAQIASECSTAAGVTHTSNVDKTEFTATIQVGGTETVALDVTVVVANGASTGSIYYYSQFLLQPMDAVVTGVPTVAPVAVPTNAPVAMVVPTDSPVTETPVAMDVPTAMPISDVEPTDAPVAAVVEPTMMPAMNDTLSPMTTQSKAPTVSPSGPVMMNMTDVNSTDAPVSSPVVRAPTSTTSFAVMISFPVYHVSSLLTLAASAVVVTIL